jgi:subtilase family serine protease
MSVAKPGEVFRFSVSLVAGACLLLGGTASAADVFAHTNAIRGAKVNAMAKPATKDDTSPVFECEISPFDLVNGWCYGPGAIRKAYGVYDLIKEGNDGSGETIVIIDAFGSPTVEADLAEFDSIYGLPAPPSFQIIHMPGSPPFDFLDGNQLGWAEETSLDVQWSHAMAPGAKIIVIAAVNNSLANLLDAQNYAIDHKLGHIMSESFGASELALLQSGASGKQYLKDSERSYKHARQEKISVLVSAGDDGASGFDINGNLVAVPVADYPASSPQVTTVGGTELFFGTATNADPNGTYQGEVVWNDCCGSGGGGISQAFNEPNYQNSLDHKIQKQLKGKRGYPDIAYNGGVISGVIVFLGFLGPALGDDANGFYIFGGTSAGAPQWAAMTALGNQLSGKHLGFLNKRIYKLADIGVLKSLTHDVTIGDNSFNGVTGFSATKGWDLATGWGTPNFGKLLRFLGDCDGDDDGNGDP